MGANRKQWNLYTRQEQERLERGDHVSSDFVAAKYEQMIRL